MSKNTMPGVDSRTEREIFGQNFREARMRIGLSQRDVHRMTGVAQSHISEIETGISNISIDTMVKLSKTVKRPLWKLFKPRAVKTREPLAPLAGYSAPSFQRGSRMRGFAERSPPVQTIVGVNRFRQATAVDFTWTRREVDERATQLRIRAILQQSVCRAFPARRRSRKPIIAHHPIRMEGSPCRKCRISPKCRSRCAAS